MIRQLFIGTAALVLGAVSSVFAQPSLFAPRLAAAQDAAPPAASGEQRLELSEQTLTDQLNQRLVGQPFVSTPLGPASLTHITARLNNGQMLTDGDAQVGWFNVPVSLSSRMDARDGRIVVSVVDASAAGMPLPDSTRQLVQQSIQAQADQEVDRMQVQVTSVAAADGKLVIVGTPLS